jgi:hypothetical protein
MILVSTLCGQSSEARDLAKYRTRRSIHITLADPERSRKESDLRAFLWENWQEHRRAKVIESNVSIEGERSVVEFFVEPNSDGVWKAEVEVQREVFSRGRENRTRSTEKVSYTCTSLERVEPPVDLLRPLAAIASELYILPSMYRLHPLCEGESKAPILW